MIVVLVVIGWVFIGSIVWIVRSKNRNIATVQAAIDRGEYKVENGKLTRV